jgi:nucleoid-associated protein YgaU
MSLFSRQSLEKLTIKYELRKGDLFSGGLLTPDIEVLFNPNKLSFQRSQNWQTVNPAALSTTGRRGRLQYQNTTPETLSVEFFFDTYELSSERQGFFSALNPLGNGPDPISVLNHTIRMEKLAEVVPDLHRPPVCKLLWGGGGKKQIFKGVLTQMSKTLELFHPNGTPLRATMQCTFTDVEFTGELHSADVDKRYVVKPRDTLLAIAADLYEDSSLWRVIAQANGIDDPRALTPGQVLAIPKIQ